MARWANRGAAQKAATAKAFAEYRQIRDTTKIPAARNDDLAAFRRARTEVSRRLTRSTLPWPT
ncbi:hypothetical protein ACNTMW_20855 [Planosporangium sp. 12N6]|uniref:hypothetical protein n=1 Tax=Planosporangium spinosum TaxID=3402278 RepID=UPI003CF21470